ncbi:MAG TPA: protein kinase [Povalibacter sp.]|nr:protein kinase [Povalibacter sp.]
MGNEPVDKTANARSDLATWLDDYTAGRCDRTQMQASFLEICRSNPEAPWDALALLDQYQRRGRIDAVLARSLKSDIAQLVFGVVNQTEEDEDETRPPDSEPPPDSETTGSRWRRLMADRKAASAQSNEAFVDPVQFSRDIDPMTRPPAPARRQSAVVEGTAPGSVLRDRYELLTILGRGGTGTVYKALDRHRAHLDASARCVALRVLKLNYRDSPQALAELEQQFHQAQSLSHPNIVNVFDLDRDGGTYFMVMELLEGELLSDMLARLDRKPMQRDRALAIIGSIGAALAHAHRRGIVHADLKPGNVMVAANGEVKVLDFGFVRRQYVDRKRDEPWIGDPAASGSITGGTLAYASEERVNAEAPDESEDVYSLGCIAYEMLSGQHPYGGRSAQLARAHGRRPQRIAGLNNRQWSALQAALQWSRAERKIGVVELIAGLGCANVRQELTPPQQIMAASAGGSRAVRNGAIAVALLAVVAALVYWRGPLPQFIAQSLPDTATRPAPASVEKADVEKPTAPAAGPAPDAVMSQPATSAPPAVVPTPVPAPEPAQQQPKPQKKAAAVANPSDVQDKVGASGPSRISFDKDTYVATESDGSVKLTVRRTGSTRDAVTFHWTLLPNSAVAGEDYAAIGPGTEHIPAGRNSATLTIPLVSDAIKEPTELFLVELSADDATTQFGELTRAAVIIVDDD